MRDPTRVARVVSDAAGSLGEREDGGCGDALARWNREKMFVEAREELAAWRLSREAFPRYEEELAKLKAAVPRSEIPDVVAPMVIGGDWDAFYRRFLSAQNGKAAKAEKMLRGMIEWRSGLDLEGKMRVWSSIPDETKDSTFEGYQSGWYTAETAIGCPVYIERTGTLNLGEVLKHVPRTTSSITTFG